MSPLSSSQTDAQLPPLLAKVAVFHDMDGRLPPRVLVHEFSRGRFNPKTGAYGEDGLRIRGKDVMAFMAGRDVSWPTGSGVYAADLCDLEGYFDEFRLEELADSDVIRAELGDSCPERVYLLYRTCDRSDKDLVVRQLVDATERMLNERMLVAVRGWTRVQEFVSSGAAGHVPAPVVVDTQAIASLVESQMPAGEGGCGQAAAREALSMIASDVAGGGQDPLASIDAAVAALLRAREAVSVALMHGESLKELDAHSAQEPTAERLAAPGR